MYLSKLQLIYFRESAEKEDKLIILSLLSAINVIVTLSLFGIIMNKTIQEVLNFVELSWSEFLVLILLSVIYTLIGTFYLYPFLFTKISKNISTQLNQRAIIPNEKSPLTYTLFKSPNFDLTYVYVFDFQGNFIESGYWREYDYDGFGLLGLGGPTTNIKNDPTTIDEVVLTYNSLPDDEAKEIVDLKNSIRIFIFYSNEEKTTD